MIRYATIGTSDITKSFIAGAALSGEFELGAVYSRDYERGKAFATEHGASEVYTDINKLAQSQTIQAVYIASPNSLHFEQSKLFLENGKHVICEKPITSCAKEYKELKALADSKSLIYMEAIIPIYVKNYNKIKAALKEIGNIKAARIDFCQYSSRIERFLNGEKINVFDMSLYGGCLMDLGVYCVWAAIDLLGVPKDISAHKTLIKDGVDGSGCAVFCYDDFNAVLTYSKTGQSVIGSEIIGDKGTLKIDLISQYSGVSLVQKGTVKEIVGTPTKAELMSGEAKRFADYILNFQANAEDYAYNSEHCYAVHCCMDKMKEKANIKYL